MELLISKIDDSGKMQLNVKFITSTGEEDFDYIKLIEYLYHNTIDNIKLTYTENISEEEKNKIDQMFNDIKNEVINIESEPKKNSSVL